MEKSCISQDCWEQAFLESKGTLQEGVRKDPTLAEFEAELAKYHATQSEILVSSDIMSHTSPDSQISQAFI